MKADLKMFRVEKPRMVCVCGRAKENPGQRWCCRCQGRHHAVAVASHQGRSTGPRKPATGYKAGVPVVEGPYDS